MNRRFFFGALASMIAFPNRLLAKPNVTIRPGGTTWKPPLFFPEQVKALESIGWEVPKEQRMISDYVLTERHFDNWGNA